MKRVFADKIEYVDLEKFNLTSPCHSIPYYRGYPPYPSPRDSRFMFSRFKVLVFEINDFPHKTEVFRCIQGNFFFWSVWKMQILWTLLLSVLSLLMMLFVVVFVNDVVVVVVVKGGEWKCLELKTSSWK